jgi:hypothetical protein
MLRSLSNSKLPRYFSSGGKTSSSPEKVLVAPKLDSGTFEFRDDLTRVRFFQQKTVFGTSAQRRV